MKQEDEKEKKRITPTQHLSFKDVKSFQKLEETRSSSSSSSSSSSTVPSLLSQTFPLHSNAEIANMSRDGRSSLTRMESYSTDYKNSTNWNEELRLIIEQIKDEAEKYEKISNLAENFDATAVTYAKVIISELCFPDAQKTIKPIKIGGIAGGRKYIVQGIMFKIGSFVHSFIFNNTHLLHYVTTISLYRSFFIFIHH